MAEAASSLRHFVREKLNVVNSDAASAQDVCAALEDLKSLLPVKTGNSADAIALRVSGVQEGQLRELFRWNHYYQVKTEGRFYLAPSVRGGGRVRYCARIEG